MKPRLLILLGTKAQLIKMAPVLRLLTKRGIPYTLIFTGQHQETITALRHNFGLKEFDFQLYHGSDIARPWQSIPWFWQVLQSAQKLQSHFLLSDRSQQVLLVHGDTFSTLLGAVLGKLWHVKVAHVEAGLRSGSWWQPFPEEITRIVVGWLAQIHFYPGEWAGNHIAQYHHDQMINTQANTLLDTVKLSLQQPTRFPTPNYPFGVVSFHRFENLYHQHQLRQVLAIIFLAAKQHSLLFVLHPATQHRLASLGWLSLLQQHPRIQLIPRLDSPSFLHLVAQAAFVLTDGGSNQEECAYLGVPALLLRQVTERPEGLGENIVLSRLNLTTAKNFLSRLPEYRRPAKLASISPSQIIVDWLQEHYL